MSILATHIFLLRRRIESYSDYVCKDPDLKEALEEWITELLKIENDLKRLLDLFTYHDNDPTEYKESEGSQ